MSLPAIFPESPFWGRGKSPKALPYAQVGVELEGRQPTGTATGQGDSTWYDNRRITIKCFALKSDLVNLVKQVLAVFNLKTVLVYPSGAKFLRLWPDGNAKLYQDPNTAQGQDIWVGELSFIARSVRSI